MDDKRAIIVYYSLTTNTEQIARTIQSKTGADLFKIETIKTYPTHYEELVKEAKREKEEGYCPELKSYPENLDGYDIVYLGTPVWWYTMSSALRTFLTKVKLDGKIIYPFCTHGGGEASTTFTDIEHLQENAQVKKGLAIYENGSSLGPDEIENWINQKQKEVK